MSKEAPAEAPAETEQAAPVKVKVVEFIYGNNSNTRGLTTADFEALGIKDHKPLWWSAANSWKIPLSETDVSPEMAAVIFTFENGFRVVEVEV